MADPLEFTGNITVPGPSTGLGATDKSSKNVLLQFETITRQFDNVVSTDVPYTVTSPSAFVSMPLSDELPVAVEFVSFAVLNAGTIDFLIGTIPKINGASGTFPTGFTGGESFEFKLQTYNDTTGKFDDDFTVTTTFTAAAQSAQNVANEINAAVMLSGASTCALVSVLSGQLVLDGVTPGAEKRIFISVANATIGFDGTKEADLGTGESITVNGNFLAELAGVTGGQLWVRGTADLNILLAGT